MESVTASQVYLPFHKGLPPLRAYWRTLWKRRAFITEYSRSELHEQHYDSVFGQIWLVLNPLLLSAVYFIYRRTQRQDALRTFDCLFISFLFNF